MNISSLDITLRRINQIETRFNGDNIHKNGNSDFENILNKHMDVKTAENKQSSDISKNEINDLVKKYSQENNLDKSLVNAVIKIESNFNQNAESKVGALGLMQLMPNTASSMGVKNPLNPEENIKGGTKYLKTMLDKYKGNTELALAAYNAGPSAVNKYGSIPPYKENQEYVKKVLEYQKEY